MEGYDPVESKSELSLQTIEGEVIQEVWEESRQTANAILQKYTLQDLCQRRAIKERKELMYYI
jgi:DNA-binding IscR family transcriptional regulator